MIRASSQLKNENRAAGYIDAVVHLALSMGMLRHLYNELRSMEDDEHWLASVELLLRRWTT
jgi:hypothetical protein